MNCQEVRELSSDYLDERLALAQVSLLEDHLRSCPACYREVDALRTTISLIGSLDEIKSSPDFLDQVQRKIERGRGMARIWAWFFEPFKIKVPLEVTALIIVSIGAFYLYHKSPELSKEFAVQSPLEDLRVPQDKLEDKSPKEKTASEQSYKTAEEGITGLAKSEAQPAMPKSLELSRESGVRSLSENLKVAQDRAQLEAVEQKAKKQESDQIAKAVPSGSAKPEAQLPPPKSSEASRKARDGADTVTRQSEIRNEATQGASMGVTKAEVQPSVPKASDRLKEARKEPVASAPSPQIVDVVAEDVGLYEKRVRVLLDEVKGKLLAEDRSSESALLLTVELPKSREAEFLTALQEEARTKSEPRPLKGRGVGTVGIGGMVKERGNETNRLVPAERVAEPKTAPTPQSYLQTDEPTVTLQIRILPKK